MGRGPRKDWPGAWHHVVNRGIARRTVFEGASDIAVFTDLLERVAAEGLLEVHAYCFLTTHFHLLVRSPRGLLPAAMRRVENGYVRAFNRMRRRDGSLFRGRYWSAPVEDATYWWAVLRYIDRNPLQAGLCARSTDYPHGSARWYARREGPPWLHRSIVEAAVAGGSGGKAFDPGGYPVQSREDGGEWTAEVVERRMRVVRSGEDPCRTWSGRLLPRSGSGCGARPGSPTGRSRGCAWFPCAVSGTRSRPDAAPWAPGAGSQVGRNLRGGRIRWDRTRGGTGGVSRRRA